MIVANKCSLLRYVLIDSKIKYLKTIFKIGYVTVFKQVTFENICFFSIRWHENLSCAIFRSEDIPNQGEKLQSISFAINALVDTILLYNIAETTFIEIGLNLNLICFK